MIADLRPYPAMKDSGIQWLGKVPVHWEVHRLKYLLRERNCRSSSGKEPLLRVSQYTGVTQRAWSDGLNEQDTRSDSLVGYKSVEPEELVVNIMLAWNGSMGVSKFHGIASPAYCVYRFGHRAQPWFFHHLLRSPAYKARIKAVSTGVVASRLRLYTDNLYRLEALVPPLPEQTTIVRFLDYTTRRIEKAIREKRKLITLLNEQKHVIMNRTVTRGIDPNVRFKPSGNPWLDEIPEHWDVVPLKGVCTIQSGITLGKFYIGEYLTEFPYLRVANVQAGRLDLTNVKTLRLPLREAKRSILQVGDVLMTEGGDPDKLGRGCVWEGEINSCLHQNHVFAVRPTRDRLRPYFLAALLDSFYGKLYFLKTAKQTTNLASTNKTTIGRFRVLLPSVEEQDAILRGLEDELNPVSAAIARTEREITLLREYRTRLTADVVTGKLDVREAAKQLPEGSGEPEALIGGDEPGDETELEPALSEAV